MGQLADIINTKDAIYRCANTSVEDYIKQLTPFLEYRKTATRNFIEHKGKSEQYDKNMMALLIEAENRMKEILNFLPPKTEL